jgi:UDP-N-acetylmuramate dehydrogenase
MKVVEGSSLKGMNSFGIEARAGLLVVIESEEDVLSLPAFDPARDLVLGGGSNLLFVTDVPGTVYHNCIAGRSIVDDDGDLARVEVGAGEDWHPMVRWTLDQGLSGLENLSLIPGRAGAAPIQNIGAYGVELASVLAGVTAWDWHRAAWANLDRDACALTYRDSLFKSSAADRYLITSIQLSLDRHFRPRLEYAGLLEELAELPVDQITARDVSDAVIRLRRRKLPDPKQNGNAGSFFKNPLVDRDRLESLHAAFPDLPAWPAQDGMCKLSAAWLIERCGLKGARRGQAAISEQHALVLVNLGDATGQEIAALARYVQNVVADRFNITLEPEIRMIEFSC